VSVHSEPQVVFGAEQPMGGLLVEPPAPPVPKVLTHRPFVHTWFATQTWPQAPQLLMSLTVFVQGLAQVPVRSHPVHAFPLPLPHAASQARGSKDTHGAMPPIRPRSMGRILLDPRPASCAGSHARGSPAVAVAIGPARGLCHAWPFACRGKVPAFP
jgi:hypothetical protein